MLDFKKTVDGNETILTLTGELDTLTSMDLEKELDNLLADATDLVVDIEKLEYITSAGLRVLLQMDGMMGEKGSMKIIHPSQEVMEIFEVTGFLEVLNIE